MALTGVGGGDSCKIGLRWDLPDGVTAYNTFTWYRSDDVGGIIPFATALGYFAAKLSSMVTGLLGSIADVVSTVEINGYTYIFSGGKWVIEAIMGTAAMVEDGTAATDMAPHGVACLVSYRSAFPGTRGRTYIPGWTDVVFNASTVVSGVVTLLETWGSSYLTTIEPGSGYLFVPVVLSYKTSVPVLLTSAVVSPYAAYQRRRGPGRGS
jgi:hypothetical protein